MVLLGQFDGKSGIWKEAKMVLWSDPKSSSTQNSVNLLVNSGDVKMRFLTSSFPVVSLM